MFDSLSRRQLLGTAAAAVAVGPLVRGAAAHEETDPGSLPEKATILFQGDSITDVGRNRKREANANDRVALGGGYPLLIAAGLLKDYAGRSVRVHNRGISGNKVPDLDARWQADCIDLKPDVLSILVGVNDIWHARNGNYDGTPTDYRDGFAALLTRTREALPDVRLVICEPFVLKTGAVDDSWFPEFTERRGYAREVADGAGATWVPFQEMFDAALDQAGPSYWAGDGVHPTLAGHELMAATWRETVGI